jgi:LPS export ABC transporter protein LptC
MTRLLRSARNAVARSARRVGRRAAVAALAVVGVGLAPAGEARAGAGSGPILLIDGLTFVGTRGSRPQLVLQARHAEVEQGSDVARLREVQAHVTGEGEGGFEMACDRAEYRIDTSDFLAEGRVRGQTGDGRRFETSRLRYDHARALAVSEVPVTIVDEHGRYSGGGFRYHVGSGHFQLVGGASVIQEPREPQP